MTWKRDLHTLEAMDGPLRNLIEQEHLYYPDQPRTVVSLLNDMYRAASKIRGKKFQGLKDELISYAKIADNITADMSHDLTKLLGNQARDLLEKTRKVLNQELSSK
jgi:hypothetical protein